ncbi:hypothetical protein H072_8359 [Dactylellina haptotyla CBS 200.50]|uniref:UBZ4-type domain-containing protein n=1 Tax=Dactylellina haptotyla (strain CBS 200.50) TaxID=1284197 RepID=S8BF94_DACHA|nr:hypothetical protein H072_8359 [Dactylellina haptotyla CBS 200.50]
MGVPRHAAITPNTPVSIILKQDQPTGRQVTGFVAELLTRGDHPRGVKVRLKDGRVGRVQKIIDASAVAHDSGGGVGGFEGVGGAEGDIEGVGREFSPRGSRGGRRGRGRGGIPRERGYEIAPRDGDGVERNEGTYDLTAFIKDGRKGKRRGGASGLQQERSGSLGGLDGTSEVAVRCPVCGDFEGDERAVQHHVESHFA